MTFISHAQNQEDAILHRALADIEQGFYIDVGAHHPKIDSVTYAFYEMGWRGINIDPLNQWIEAHQVCRPEDVNLCLFVAEKATVSPFYELGDGGGLSTSDKTAATAFHESYSVPVTQKFVPCLNLNQILESQSIEQIHFLKIDAEGSEHNILQGLDLKRYRPWILLLEATLPNRQVENHSAWEPLLLEQGYDFVYSDGLNRYYLAKEHSERQRFFRYPLSVFDEVIPAKLSELHWQVVDRLREQGSPILEQLQHPANAHNMLSNISLAINAWDELRPKMESPILKASATQRSSEATCEPTPHQV